MALCSALIARRNAMDAQRPVASLLAILVLCMSAVTADASAIAFTGSRDYTGGLPGMPNPGRCGAFPPNVVLTHPPGVGTANLGPFTSSESHCANQLTGNLFDGLFTFDFGDANTFFGTYVGTVVGLPPPPPPVGTVLTVTFAYTLTGGTGIFTDATGNLLGTGTATFTSTGVNSHIDIAGTITTVPEPASALLLTCGFACVVAAGRTRRKREERR
jgi:hypothetical protein